MATAEEDKRKKEQEEKQRQQKEQKEREEQQKNEEDRKKSGANPNPGNQSRPTGGNQPGVVNTPVESPTPPGSPVRNSPVRYPTMSDGSAGEQDISIFSADELHNMRGDLLPGEFGWVKLDEEGKPTGQVSREIPERGETVARVAGVLHSYDEVVTPSGAPLTKHMNPEPALWDDGMIARNPVPEEDRNPDKDMKEQQHERMAKHFGLNK